MAKCAICGKEFKDQQGLSTHIQKTHSMAWGDYQKRFMQRLGGEKPLEEPEKRETKPVEKPETKPTELPPEVVDAIARRVAELLGKGGTEKPAAGLPEGVYPIGEEVEVWGEKVNYKVALNPEVFYLYDVFKAEAERRGKRWEGDFGDFIYMAAKDVLAVHGIHPAVLRVRGREPGGQAARIGPGDRRGVD